MKYAVHNLIYYTYVIVFVALPLSSYTYIDYMFGIRERSNFPISIVRVLCKLGDRSKLDMGHNARTFSLSRARAKIRKTRSGLGGKSIFVILHRGKSTPIGRRWKSASEFTFARRQTLTDVLSLEWCPS